MNEIQFRDAERGMVLGADDGKPWYTVLANQGEVQAYGQSWVSLRVMHLDGGLEDRLVPPDRWVSRIGLVMLPDEEMTDEQATAHLMREGNFAVSCSRYGRNTAECAEVAVKAARIFAEKQGEPLTTETLDHMMSLVVNDSDDPAHLIREFGGES